MTYKMCVLKQPSCQARLTLVNTNSFETSFSSFAVSVINCDGSCNTIDNSYDWGCALNKVKTWMQNYST